MDDRSVGPGRSLLMATALLLALSGCSSGPGEETDAPAGNGDRSSETLQGVSTKGTPVTVTPASLPVRAGPVDLLVDVDTTAEQPLPVTLDVVSPEMPIHGVLRFPSRAESPRRYRIRAEIPMDGRWMLYVNLDYGGDAAELVLDVEPGPEAGGHRHGDPSSVGDSTPATGARSHDHHGSG